MLRDLVPEAYRKYLSFPLLGSIVGDFEAWLLESGYTRSTRRAHVFATTPIDHHLRKRGVQCIEGITAKKLSACARALGRRRARTVHVLQRYLRARGHLPISPPEPRGQGDIQLVAYAHFLEKVRGFRPSTIHHHLTTARQFLDHRAKTAGPARLATLTANDVETFIRVTGHRLNRGSLQHAAAHLRGFLRFLAANGLVRPRLDSQVDTPRLYRFEQLPRALSWRSVRALLRSIDRTTPVGLRDYTMFFLMATYGFRASEIVSMTLDDIDWRGECIRVDQHKTGTPLVLPLTDEAGRVLLDYLRAGRPAVPLRQLFVRVRAPIGTLAAGAVTQAWSRRSGLKGLGHGSHCLRHSYAVHLLRRGASLKSIGDLLGHRSADSTCVYLRLAINDLRDVALPIPREHPDRFDQESES